jgi:hypothetical protein
MTSNKMSELDQFDHADEPENIRLLDNESLSIVVKKHPTTHQELVALLCETAATRHHQRLHAGEDQGATETKVSRGLRKRPPSSSINFRYTTPLQSIANFHVGQSHPELSSLIEAITTIRDPRKIPKPEYLPFDIPQYSLLVVVNTVLGLVRGQRVR